MTRTTIASAISVTITIGFLASCTSSQRGPDSEEMYVKASALTKLSAAVESTVRYKNPPPDLGDSELLELATRHDPCYWKISKVISSGCCGSNATRLCWYATRPVPVLFWKTRAVPGRWTANAGWERRRHASFPSIRNRFVAEIDTHILFTPSQNPTISLASMNRGSNSTYRNNKEGGNEKIPA
jgi:hypothetical protein